MFIFRGPALRVIRAGTRLTVHRSLPYQNHSKAGQSGAAHADAHDHRKIVLDKNIIDKCSRELHDCFRLCVEDLDRSNEIEK